MAILVPMAAMTVQSNRDFIQIDEITPIFNFHIFNGHFRSIIKTDLITFLITF
jgi:hypothetical protein